MISMSKTTHSFDPPWVYFLIFFDFLWSWEQKTDSLLDYYVHWIIWFESFNVAMRVSGRCLSFFISLATAATEKTEMAITTEAQIVDSNQLPQNTATLHRAKLSTQRPEACNSFGFWTGYVHNHTAAYSLCFCFQPLMGFHIFPSACHQGVIRSLLQPLKS